MADALCEAARTGQKDRVSALVKSQGANPNERDASGRTALHWSVDKMKFAVVKELLDLGALVDVPDQVGDTPVHIAVRNCRGAADTIGKMMVDVLVNRAQGSTAALLNMQTGNGDTPLHIAVRQQNVKVLELLGKHRPSFAVPNAAGETAMSISQSCGPEVQALVRQYAGAGGGGGAASNGGASRNNSGGGGGGGGGAVRNAAGRQLPQPGGGGGAAGGAAAAGAPIAYAQSQFSSQMGEAANKVSAMGAAALSAQPSASGAAAMRPGGQQRVSDASGILPALQKLQDHIKRLFDTDGFEDEFMYLESLTAQAIQNEDFTTALYPHNKEKNRYTNILPFERTRVRLGTVEGLVGSDYINANYMEGETPGSERAFIAAQGPKEVTVFDFWRMIYELEITSVVMLGNHIEDNKIKFWQYWPDDNTAIDIGYFRVTFKNTESFYGEVYLRRYTLTNTYTGEVRDIAHLKYTAFPDHGVPNDTSGFLKLVTLAEDEAVRGGRPRRPICVHCSAGVGRTGMYIAVAITVAKLNYATTASLLGKPPIPLNFDLLNTLVHMRKQRPGMVQTKEQLIFCYLAILEKVITQCNILDFENERWFNKVSAHAAIDILSSEREGAFLFRPSSARGFCSMSYKKGGDVHHVRIEISKDGFICEGDDLRYSSLTRMVENKRAVLQHPVFSY